jgi:predicted phage terminase large subunit-like protein
MSPSAPTPPPSPTPSSPPSPAAAAAELLRRRTIRRSLSAFCAAALHPLGQAPAAHHRLLIGELEALALGEGGRAMVMMPPGSAKSTYASVLFPAWFLARAPGLSVIGASHTAALAERFSRRVQATLGEHAAALGCEPASEAAELWQTTTGGEYRAAGVGAGIAGFRADLAVVDDPVRSREEAESEAARERTWAWFLADLLPRLKPGGRVVLVLTRWHQDDLAGRLLEAEPDRWRVLRLPALAGDDDPLGRAPGEPLWADDGYGYGAGLRRIRDAFEAAGAARDWASLYQQDPRPAEGALFKVGMIPLVEAAAAGAGGRAVRAWDLAATAQAGTRDPDWTAGVLLRREPGGERLGVEDVVRLRGGPHEVEAAILAAAARDGRAVTVALPQDPGQAGKAQVQHLTRRLAGFTVVASPETGSKATRAAPVASQANVGNLAVVRAAWTRGFLAELADFPAGRHDDQVDALARAFDALGAGVHGYDTSMKWVGDYVALQRALTRGCWW